MAQSKITLIGMEKYLNPDHSVFEQMQLPEGIDKDTLIGSIILRCNEFELLYSDPDFMIAAVNVWSRKNYWTFDKWVKAINIDYDPLYNYDRTESSTDTHEGEYGKEGKDTHSGSDTRTNNLTMTNNLKTENDTTVTHKEKAYNDASFVPTTEDATDGEIKDTGSVTNTGTVTDAYGRILDAKESGTDKYTDTHESRMYGNIGVTTSQQMLQSELDIARWNMYEHIADLFCQEFCIMVY